MTLLQRILCLFELGSYGVYTSTKKHKMALITDHLPADLSPDASADAPPRINIGHALRTWQVRRHGPGNKVVINITII